MYLILGLARSGLATAAFLQKRGLDFVVHDDRVTDHSYPILKASDWANITTIVISPGIPVSYPTPHPVIQRAQEHNCEIITDCTLLRRFAQDKKFIGITGTNGKSTTTALVTHILREAGIDAVMGGNIGVPALELGLDHDVYVLELSSFQLERSPAFNLDVAVWLNLSEDHLIQHGTMEAYTSAKQRIFDNARIGIKWDDAHESISLPEHSYLKGDHNEQNRTMAYRALKVFGLVHDVIMRGMATFKGLKHRQQYVGVLGKVTFINDSKATSANATEQALKTFDTIYWLVGGQDKSDGINSLAPYFSKIKKAYVFGAAKDRFSKTFAD
ncbi:MAG: UDP-N-acetylmuramoyl-L-alanine--D-glutamate ligase, partial [Alphaproteobacteria bacterium]|nr:UDP-N-acetylmuramoyl-L-alanine--D-glutamate ligase [Alphaproteobacteria bacterium]